MDENKIGLVFAQHTKHFLDRFFMGGEKKHTKYQRDMNLTFAYDASITK